MKIAEKEIIYRQLRWLNLYLSELKKLEPPGMPGEQYQEIMRLRSMAKSHFWLHTQLLLDAVIMTFVNLLDTPGHDQKSGEARKVTLEYFLRQLPCAHGTKAKALLDDARASSAFAEARRARDQLIAYPDRAMLVSYVGQPAQQVFPNLSVNRLEELRHQVMEIAWFIDPMMDLSIPEYVGVDELVEVLQRVPEG